MDVYGFRCRPCVGAGGVADNRSIGVTVVKRIGKRSVGQSVIGHPLINGYVILRFFLHLLYHPVNPPARKVHCGLAVGIGDPVRCRRTVTVYTRHKVVAAGYRVKPPSEQFYGAFLRRHGCIGVHRIGSAVFDAQRQLVDRTDYVARNLGALLVSDIEVIDGAPGKRGNGALIGGKAENGFVDRCESVIAGQIHGPELYVKLIAAGRLPKPRRTIRMLLVPEMLGSNAYLHTLGEGGRKKLIAGVNLDMVGARQGATAGPVIIFRTPEASASLVNDLACLALDEASSDHPAVFSDTEKVGMHHYAVRRFGSGSDHQIFSDPLIGVPCVSFTQWPDLFYHTSGDTVERIDPTLVTKTALIAGDIIWTLANMRESDLDPLLARACESYVAALRRETDLWRAKNEPARALELRLNLTEEAAARALGDLRRLFPGELSATAQALLADERVKLEALKEQALRRALALAGLHRDEAVSKAASDLPKLVRTFLGDPDAARIDKLFEESGSEELIRQHKENHTLESYVNCWTCGLFNFEEIADRALWECGSGDREYIGQYLRILNRAGLVKPVSNAK